MKTAARTAKESRGFGALRRSVAKPARFPRCRFEETGDVSYRLCPRGGHCERCAFAQMIEDRS